MRPNLGLYIQNINQIVQETEAIGENLNPKYEEIRQAIDQEQLAEISAEKISEIVETFANGTSKYEAML